MSYATRVPDHVDVTSVYFRPILSSTNVKSMCVVRCMCRFVSKIHSRQTVLEFKELLSNPAVLSVRGWRREMKLNPAKLFI